MSNELVAAVVTFCAFQKCDFMLLASSPLRPLLQLNQIDHTESLITVPDTKAAAGRKLEPECVVCECCIITCIYVHCAFWSISVHKEFKNGQNCITES